MSDLTNALLSEMLVELDMFKSSVTDSGKDNNTRLKLETC